MPHCGICCQEHFMFLWILSWKKRNELTLTRKENEAVMLWGYLRKNILPKTIDITM